MSNSPTPRHRELSTHGLLGRWALSPAADVSGGLDAETDAVAIAAVLTRRMAREREITADRRVPHAKRAMMRAAEGRLAVDDIAEILRKRASDLTARLDASRHAAPGDSSALAELADRCLREAGQAGAALDRCLVVGDARATLQEVVAPLAERLRKS